VYKPRAVPEAEVIDVGRIGNDEVSLAAHLHEIWRIVVIGIRVVKEATLLNDKTPSPHAWPVPAIPAYGPAAACSDEGFDGELHVRALFLLGEAKYFLPSVAVAADLVAAGNSGLRDSGILLEGDRASVEGGPELC